MAPGVPTTADTRVTPTDSRCDYSGGAITSMTFIYEDKEPEYIEEVDEFEPVPREKRTVIRTILMAINPRCRSPPGLELWKENLNLQLSLKD